MVETLALGSGSREDSSGASSSVSDDGSDSGNRGGGAGLLSGGLVVTVDGSWELKRRVNLMAVDQAEAAVVGVTAQSLRCVSASKHLKLARLNCVFFLHDE
jgi:hypothetical protein